MTDWKNPKDYPSEKEAEEASNDLWAWFFLLRNPSFQNELTAARMLPSPKSEGQDCPLGWNQTPVGQVLKKWGVKYPMLPEWIKAGLSDSPVRFLAHPEPAQLVTIEGRRYRVMPDSESRLVLEFDLAAPIPPQLARAKKMLIASKEQIKNDLPKDNRKQVGMYPLYLRVLDAKAAKITKSKMAEVFSVERPEGVTEKDIDNWLKAAEELAKAGYRRLAKLSA